MNKDILKQCRVPFIGAFRQVLGGAMSWVTMMTFAFAGLAAWNTDTVQEIRDSLPWLNLGWFIGIIVLGLVVAMFVEHKWVQPSIMSYWNQMFYSQNNPIVADQKRIEEKVDRILELLGEKTDQQ